MFNIEYHEKEVLAVGYKGENQTEDKWNQLNLTNLNSLLGTNHRLNLSYMANSYICLEEKNQHINEFSIGYMMNPNLSMKKYFKEQVKVCIKTKFSTSTMTHISKISLKPNTIVLSLVMFF